MWQGAHRSSYRSTSCVSMALTAALMAATLAAFTQSGKAVSARQLLQVHQAASSMDKVANFSTSVKHANFSSAVPTSTAATDSSTNTTANKPSTSATSYFLNVSMNSSKAGLVDSSDPFPGMATAAEIDSSTSATNNTTMLQPLPAQSLEPTAPPPAAAAALKAPPAAQSAPAAPAVAQQLLRPGPAPGSGSPFRLIFDYTLLKANSSLLTADQASMIETQLGPAAAQRLSDLLQVRMPLQGPLKAPLTSLPASGSCGFELPAAVQAGVPDADMVLVAFSDHPICRDTGTLWYAQAKYCDYDPETGRPTLGGMLVCPNFFRIESTAGRVESLVHEAFHGLGFTASALPRWRDYRSQQTYNQVVLQTEDGDKPSWLVTPRVMNLSRTYFACPSLPGAPLDLSTGMHWWQKALPFDIMIGKSVEGIAASPFTLAAMEDTGWYIANYQAVSNPTFNKDAGCEAAGL